MLLSFPATVNKTDRSVGSLMLPDPYFPVKQEVYMKDTPATAHVGTAALGCPAAQVYRAAVVLRAEVTSKTRAPRPDIALFSMSG